MTARCCTIGNMRACYKIVKINVHVPLENFD